MIVHFDTGWEPLCSKRNLDRKTTDPKRVTCTKCSDLLKRLAAAKTKPNPKWKERLHV